MSTSSPDSRRNDNPLEELLGYQLRRVSAALMGDLSQRLEPLDLRPSEASILLLIHANPRIRQSEIGQLLGIKSANMTPLVAALERRSLVVREPIDGRSHGLRATEPGAALGKQVQKVVEAHERHILPSLSDKQRKHLVSLLRQHWT